MRARARRRRPTLESRLLDSPATESAFPTRRPEAFRHDAVFYRGERGFLPAVLPFVSAAVERDEPVLVAVLPAREQALRNELGPASKRVEFVDMQSAGRNPACIIPVWNDFVSRNSAGGKALNGVGEPIWPERTAPEIAECQRHESLLNLAFARAGSFALICPYDEAAPARGRPRGGAREPPACRRGRQASRQCLLLRCGLHRRGRSQAARAAQRVHESRAFEGGDVTSVRHELTRWAIANGLDPARAADLGLAVHEAAVNSIRHGGGRGVLRWWRGDDSLVCEVEDAGELRDPLAGRSLPAPESANGRGLWLINHLCDLVQLRQTPSGAVVRMQQQLRSP